MFSRILSLTGMLAAALVACTPQKPAGPFVPAPATLRRLTSAQLENTLRDRFGSTLVLPPAIEADVTAEESISIGASHAGYSARGVEMSRQLADSVGEQALAEPIRSSVVPCVPQATRDDACAEATITSLGRYLWRRPLAADEVATLVRIAGESAVVRNDFYNGLRYAVITLLMAPDFLFRVEVTEDALDLASRLSFFLWDTSPDDALLEAALSGDLEKNLTTHVRRMLADPLAHRGARAFLADWLQLQRLDDMVRDTNLFPSFSPDLGRSAQEEILRTGEHLIFDKNADFRDWMVSRETFVNRRLASLYAVPYPKSDAEFALVTLPEDGARRGFFGTAAFLAMNAHPTTTSPTVRGKYLSQIIICKAIPDPPVGLNTGIPEPAENAVTLRQRVIAHQQNEGCATCHKLTDPQGLAFEQFDAIGRFRTKDGDAPIDASGDFNGRHFEDAKDLGAIIRDDDRLPRCVTKRLYRYALGHVDTADDKAEVDRLTAEFATSGYRVISLMEGIATSEAFRRVGPPAEDEVTE